MIHVQTSAQRLVTTWTETSPTCTFSADRSHIIVASIAQIEDGVTVFVRDNESYKVIRSNSQGDGSSILGGLLGISSQGQYALFVNGIDANSVVSGYSTDSSGLVFSDSLDSLQSVATLLDGAALLYLQRHSGEFRVLFKEGPQSEIDTLCLVSERVFTDRLSDRFYSIDQRGVMTARSVITCDTIYSFTLPSAASLLTRRFIAVDRPRGLTYVAMDNGRLVCYDEMKNTVQAVLSVESNIVALDVDERDGQVVVTTPESVIVMRNGELFKTLQLDNVGPFESLTDAVFCLDGNKLLVANSLYSEWVDLGGSKTPRLASINSTPFSIFKSQTHVLIIGSYSRAYSLDLDALRIVKSREINHLSLTFNSGCSEFVRFNSGKLHQFDYLLEILDTIVVSNHDNATCLAFTCELNTALFYQGDSVCIHDLSNDKCLSSIDCSLLGTVRSGQIDESKHQVVLSGQNGGMVVENAMTTPIIHYVPLLRTRVLDRHRRVLPDHFAFEEKLVLTLHSTRSFAYSWYPFDSVSVMSLPDPTSSIKGIFSSASDNSLYIADNKSHYWCFDPSSSTLTLIDSTSIDGKLSTMDRNTATGVNTVSHSEHNILEFSSDCALTNVPEALEKDRVSSSTSIQVHGTYLTAIDAKERLIKSVQVYDYLGRLIEQSSTNNASVVVFADGVPACPMYVRVTGNGWSEVTSLLLNIH